MCKIGLSPAVVALLGGQGSAAEQMLFMSDRVDNPDLFIIDADGAHPGIDVSPTWSPRPLTTLARARSWGQIKAQRGYPGPFSTGAK